MNPLKKLNKRIKKTSTFLCVGLDSDISKLPKRFLSQKYPQFEFNRWIIEQTHPFVCAYKPNFAFYEARGERGWSELAMTTSYIINEHPDIFLIADAKRADIGSTNEGYVTAIFDQLGFDAVTLNPYLGKEALEPFLSRKDKVSIILCKTSNSGSGEIQDLLVDGQPLWQYLAKQVTEKWNKLDNCMLVVGATYPHELKKIRQIVGEMPLLVPGVGEQGGDLEAVLQMGVNQQGKGLVINSSRGVIFADDPGAEVGKLSKLMNSFMLNDDEKLSS